MSKLKKQYKNQFILDKLDKNLNKLKSSTKRSSKETDILKYNKKYLMLLPIEKQSIQIVRFLDSLQTLNKYKLT